MSKPAAIYLELTEAQLKLVRPFLDYATQECAAGRKGIVVAQIGAEFPDEMRVGFWDHNQADAVLKAFAQPTEGNAK